MFSEAKIFLQKVKNFFATRFRAMVFAALLLFPAAASIFAWGFWAHKQINRMAVFTLPPEMIGFYKKHIDFISEHAVDPDKRRYANPEEAPRHYIDADNYGDHPFDSIPQRWSDAVKKYGEDSLKAHGIVPWHINSMYYQLTDAFKEKNIERILKVSADIGHYIGDAHVPLHCTKNYNGQLTNQVGIHGFWESRIPELLGNDYDYFTGRAQYIEAPLKIAWKIVRDSYAAKDSVLLFEKQLTEKFDPDKKYAFEDRLGATVKTYSSEFSKTYNEMLGNMVERRMRESVIMVGSFWYTAWVNAGQPDLDSIMSFQMSDEYKKQLDAEEKMWRTGKAPDKGHAEH